MDNEAIITSQDPVGLTQDEENSLYEALNMFSKWLKDKKIVKTIPTIYLGDFPFSDKDWTMQWNPQSGVVSFNSFARKDCSFEYYTSIVLHEFFHLAVQKVPNKDDATRIKDDFGGELMKLIDIEADFYTALFYKEVWNYGLVQYLKLYHEGSKVFQDKWIRVGKLERFIGTLLSISKMFINHHNSVRPVKSYDLYLVSISPFFTEDSLHVLVIRKEHIYFDLIQASMQDFNKIKECYVNNEGISYQAYVQRIINFVSKALLINIPQELHEEITKLKN